MNLSTETHIILFHDHSTLLISEKEALAVQDAILNPNTTHLRIHNQLYSKSIISKVLDILEYYNQYPDKMPNEPISKPSDFKKEWLNTKQVKPETLKKLRDIKNKLIRKEK